MAGWVIKCPKLPPRLKNHSGYQLSASHLAAPLGLSERLLANAPLTLCQPAETKLFSSGLAERKRKASEEKEIYSLPFISSNKAKALLLLSGWLSSGCLPHGAQSRSEAT